jgi:7-cyano-7-deazaguanine synthase
MSKAIVVLSGGMDSTTAVYWAQSYLNDPEISLISFNYGQRHKRELVYARDLAEYLDLNHHIVDLQSVRPLIATSALTTQAVDVPEGHYEEESMRATVVPNRNMMMLSIAYAAAVSEDADYVAIGVHAGDHAVYPDCRPEFIDAFNKCAIVANLGFARPYTHVVAPFINMSKTEIAGLGKELGVPWHMTWSCYKGGEKHCGRCSTCVERLEALHGAGCDDSTEYEDTEYWKEVTNATQ